jgi:recombinational DNA repair protein RecR
MKNRYQMLRRLGICTWCGNTYTDRSLCEECTDKARKTYETP